MTINSLFAITCIVVTAAGWAVIAGTITVAILDWRNRRRHRPDSR